MELSFDLYDGIKSIKKIEKYSKSLKVAQENAMRELSARAQEKLLENMIKYGVNSADIFGSIDINVGKDYFNIVVGAEHAIFLEFGTGIVGAENPHPNPKKVGWLYGNKGWWYPTTPEKQMNYPNQPTTIINGQLYAFTKGQSSKPFIYDTWLWVSRSASNILRKHIRSIKV